jgi:hypothetical protein
VYVTRALLALVADSCDPKIAGCHPHSVQEYWPLLVVALVALAAGVASVVVVAVFVARRRRRLPDDGPVDVTLQPDGSLTCRWSGGHGPGSAVFVPQHESYRKVLDAVGGIHPGETRRIDRLPD